MGEEEMAAEEAKGPRYGVNETPVSKAPTTTSSKASKQTKKSKKSEKEKEEERVKSAAKPQVQATNVVTSTCREHHHLPLTYVVCCLCVTSRLRVFDFQF